MLTDDDRRRLTRAWTMPQPGLVDTSTGPTNLYLDGVSLILAHHSDWVEWIEDQLLDTNGEMLWPVAQGQSGALILGILGYGTLHAWGNGRRMGPEWRNLPTHNESNRVALVDDCQFSGATMRELRTACEAIGWSVAKEIICALRDD